MSNPNPNDLYDPFSDNINYSTPFQYPDEDKQLENEKLADIKCNELLRKLATYILPDKNPILSFVSLLYVSGIDISYILDCENTVSSIATRLGVSKQLVSHYNKKVTKDFGIIHTNSTTLQTIRKQSAKNNFKRQ
jgi:hypothetical protein